MSLKQTIDNLITHVGDQPIPHNSERRERFDELDRAVWVEACKLGYENKLPPESGLGLTHLPGTTLMNGDYIPIGVKRWTNCLLALRTLAEGTPEAESKDKQPDKAVTSDISLDARAVGVFLEHPDWTKKKMAKHLKCNEKSLAPGRCPKLDAAKRAYRAPDRKIHHGSKDADGNIEAWEE